MVYEAIDTPGPSVTGYSSSVQVKNDLYLITWAELELKKVENLLDKLQKVKV